MVLMTNHGMAVRGPSIRQVVFSAFYIMQNAQVQLQSLMLSGGRAPAALDAKEITDCKTTAGASLFPRAWNLWTKQVDLNPLYVNDLRNGTTTNATGF